MSISGNAVTVTTNANLNGVVTSSGNTTSYGSQTVGVLGNAATGNTAPMATSTLYGFAPAGGYVLGWDNITSGINWVATSTSGGGTVTAVTGTWPILSSGGTAPDISWGGLATSSPLATASGLLYATGVNTLASISTSSALSMSITGNAATVTTNANLNGVVTSSGNTTSYGSQTAGGLGNAITGNTAPMATSTLYGIAPAGGYVLGWNNITSGINWVATSTGGGGTVTAVTGAWPILSSGGTTPDISWGGLATSSQLAAASGLLYATGVNTLASISTSTAVSMSITGNAATVTINANLNGVVTSSGNTTSYGSQTVGVLGNAATGNTAPMATSTLYGFAPAGGDVLGWDNLTSGIGWVATSTGGGGTVTAVTGTWPVLSSGGTTPDISWGGLATSSQLAAASGLLYATGVNTLASISTSTAVSMSITGNAATVTTNANLNGVVTSSGNTTSYGSQTAGGLGKAITGNTPPMGTSTLYGIAPAGGYVLGWNNITSCINWVATSSTAGGVTSVTGTYPILSSGGATPDISIAFGTTTTNTWAGTQTFTNAPTLATFTGLVGANSGVSYAISTSSPLNTSITGNAATVTTNANLSGVVTSSGNTTSYGSQASGVLGNAATGNTAPMATSTLYGASTGGIVLGWSNATGGIAWVATSSAVTAVTGTWPIISSGGTTPNLTFGGLSTTTAAVVGNIPYFSGVNTFANVATTTLSVGNGLSVTSGTLGYQIGGANVSIGIGTNALTLTQLPQIAANTILGNNTGALGNVVAFATSPLGLLTTDIIEGSKLFYTDDRVQSFIHASTTIPKTYTNNTFIGTNTFSALATLSGGILANNATSTITNLTMVNSTSTNATTTYLSVGMLASTTNLVVSGQSAASGDNCLKINTSGQIFKTGSACGTGGITDLGPAGQFQTGSAQTLATTTSDFNGLTVGLTIIGNSNTQTFTPALSGTLGIAGGGTGTTTAPVSQLLYGGAGGIYQSVATTSVTCTGSNTCTPFVVLGSSPITIDNASGAGPWTTNGNDIYNNNVGNVGVGTSTPWAKFSVGSANASALIPLFAVASSSSAVATSTLFVINGDGTIGISSLGGSGTKCVQTDNNGILSAATDP